MNVQITNQTEINAVLTGELEGDVYQDGQAWVPENALALWRLDRQSAALRASAAVPTLRDAV